MVVGKKNRQTSNQSKIPGYEGEMGPGGFVARALVQREHRDSSKNGTSARTYVHTECRLPGKATVNPLEKYGN